MAGMESRLLFTEFYKCRPVRILNKGWGLFLFCLFFVFCGFMVWQLFSPQIKNVFSPARAERAKIAMHDEQTFQQLRLKHGKVNTGIVVYEADGKVWYYKDGKKIAFK